LAISAANWQVHELILFAKAATIATHKEHSMEAKTFNGDQKIKLIQIINEGMQVTQEIETLTGGLNDTIKAIAEELEIKPGVLKKAIKLAHKAEFGKAKQDHELLETILETVGKTL
jgi:hypothetical protein